MLEWGDVLRTWELPELPTEWAKVIGVSKSSDQVLAAPLADHRIAYLDFEGALTGNRGSVTRCDRGEFEVIDESPTVIEIKLRGERLVGGVRLERDASDWRMSTGC